MASWVEPDEIGRNPYRLPPKEGMMLGTKLSRRRPLLPALLLAGVALGAPSAASATTFSNNAGITINDGQGTDVIQALATPYPSRIAVSGLGGRVIKDVNVTLTGLTHTWPSDVRALLVGPKGHATLLLHKNGSAPDANNLTLTFDDAAAQPPPTDGSALTSGTYKPSNQSEGGGCGNFSATSSFPAPAPAGPYGSALGGFNASKPNGDWKLYVVDDFQAEPGSIAGWSLDITAVRHCLRQAHRRTGRRDGRRGPAPRNHWRKRA
jgi:subtilisin-like proprotein convertase family protein